MRREVLDYLRVHWMLLTAREDQVRRLLDDIRASGAKDGANA